MKLKIRDRNFDLSITKVMGILSLDPKDQDNFEELLKSPVHVCFGSGICRGYCSRRS